MGRNKNRKKSLISGTIFSDNKETKDVKDYSEDTEIRNKVYITKKVKTLLDYITNSYEYEIMIWLLGTHDSENIYITDYMMPIQQAGTSEVNVDKKDLVKMRIENKDKEGKIIGQFHSHAKMGAFWSVVDKKMQMKYCNISGNPLDVFIVGSKGDYLVRIAINTVFKCFIDNIKLTTKEEEEELLLFKEEIKNKVTEIKYAPLKKIGTQPKMYHKNWKDYEPFEKSYFFGDEDKLSREEEKEYTNWYGY